jgi:hypothetical protein
VVTFEPNSVSQTVIEKHNTSQIKPLHVLLLLNHAKFCYNFVYTYNSNDFNFKVYS